MKIGFIGVGRLGLGLALLIEKAGYSVLASDVRPEYVQVLNEKTFNTTEPTVGTLLQYSKNIEFTVDNRRVIRECDLIFTLVQTPSLEDGSYDVSAVWKVVEDIKEEMSMVANYPKSFVVGCTTNPGDCDLFKEELPASVDVYYNPEFIAQGSIIQGIQNADMVLVGGNGHHVPLIEEIYKRIQDGFGGSNVHFMSTKAAELTKIAVNCYLTTKISYANMVGQVMVNSGMDDEVDTVLKAIGSDSRIGRKYLGFGFGFGGPCFPRDNRAFASYAEQVGVKNNIGTTTDNFNDAHSKFLKDWFISKNPDKEVPFCFKYLTYKPGTDILEESQQYRLSLDLLEEGYKVYCIDETLKEQMDDRIVFDPAPLEQVCWVDL